MVLLSEIRLSLHYFDLIFNQAFRANALCPLFRPFSYTIKFTEIHQIHIFTEMPENRRRIIHALVFTGTYHVGVFDGAIQQV